ncbi:MAG: type II toxin-antitoxin system HicA family toxin [bacterium]|nr:type II toxin-antitoxin system HicA family toxin [bacterium]MDE0288916.1 type II toxin-antitoxin system HicA family toxin [bacterium]MDE0437523.1 type II toxin-antitoxin system HicA family toxin [bacterium]
MAIPASRYPALKARKVLRLLGKIGYETERQRGSHRKLVAPSRQPIGFAFHDGVEVPPRALRHMLVERAGLTDEEIASLLWGGPKAGGGS